MTGAAGRATERNTKESYRKSRYFSKRGARCEIAHTRERKPHFPRKRRIAKRTTNSYGFVRSAVAPTGRKSARIHTFERQKVCHFTLSAPQGGRQNAKRHTFASKKVCLLALLRPVRATADLTKPYEFLSHFAILRFLGKCSFRPRVCAISHAGANTGTESPRTRARTFDFSRNHRISI